jgi:hypothetical protein
VWQKVVMASRPTISIARQLRQRSIGVATLSNEQLFRIHANKITELISHLLDAYDMLPTQRNFYSRGVYQNLKQLFIQLDTGNYQDELTNSTIIRQLKVVLDNITKYVYRRITVLKPLLDNMATVRFAMIEQGVPYYQKYRQMHSELLFLLDILLYSDRLLIITTKLFLTDYRYFDRTDSISQLRQVMLKTSTRAKAHLDHLMHELKLQTPTRRMRSLSSSSSSASSSHALSAASSSSSSVHTSPPRPSINNSSKTSKLMHALNISPTHSNSSSSSSNNRRSGLSSSPSSSSISSSSRVLSSSSSSSLSLSSQSSHSSSHHRRRSSSSSQPAMNEDIRTDSSITTTIISTPTITTTQRTPTTTNTHVPLRRITTTMTASGLKNITTTTEMVKPVASAGRYAKSTSDAMVTTSAAAASSSMLVEEELLKKRRATTTTAFLPSDDWHKIIGIVQKKQQQQQKHHKPQRVQQNRGASAPEPSISTILTSGDPRRIVSAPSHYLSTASTHHRKQTTRDYSSSRHPIVAM